MCWQLEALRGPLAVAVEALLPEQAPGTVDDEIDVIALVPPASQKTTTIPADSASEDVPGQLLAEEDGGTDGAALLVPEIRQELVPISRCQLRKSPRMPGRDAPEPSFVNISYLLSIP